MKINITEKVKILRNREGLTQAELSQRSGCGTSPYYVWMLEKGKGSLFPEKTQFILNYLKRIYPGEFDA